MTLKTCDKPEKLIPLISVCKYLPKEWIGTISTDLPATENESISIACEDPEYTVFVGSNVATCVPGRPYRVADAPMCKSKYKFINKLPEKFTIGILVRRISVQLVAKKLILIHLDSCGLYYLLSDL